MIFCTTTATTRVIDDRALMKRWRPSSDPPSQLRPGQEKAEAKSLARARPRVMVWRPAAPYVIPKQYDAALESQRSKRRKRRVVDKTKTRRFS